MINSGQIDVKERDKLGRCPLLVAIDTDMKLDVIKELVQEHGCHPKTADASRDTALHYAVNMGRDDIADWFIEKFGEELKEIENDQGEKAYD